MHLDQYVNVCYKLAEKFIAHIAHREYKEAESIHSQFQKIYDKAIEDKEFIASVRQIDVTNTVKQIAKEKIFSAVLTQVYSLIFLAGNLGGGRFWQSPKNRYKAFASNDIARLIEINNGLQAFIKNFNDSPHCYFFLWKEITSRP